MHSASYFLPAVITHPKITQIEHIKYKIYFEKDPIFVIQNLWDYSKSSIFGNGDGVRILPSHQLSNTQRLVSSP